MRRSIAVAAVILVLSGVAACGSAGPSEETTPIPSASDAPKDPPTPTPSPTAAPDTDTDVGAARQAYIETIAAIDATRQDGFADDGLWQDVVDRLTGEAASAIIPFLQGQAENNSSQRGAIVVVSAERSALAMRSPGEVALEVCLDSSGVEPLVSGMPVDVDAESRTVQDVVMVRTTSGAHEWLLTSTTPRGTTC